MAICPRCKRKISFIRFLTPGGFFVCNHCKLQIRKKASKELFIILGTLAVALPATWTATHLVLSLYPNLIGTSYTALIQTIFGVVFAGITSLLLWSTTEL